MNLSDPIRFVKGIGPKKAEQFEKLGLYTLNDVLAFYPRSYEDRSAVIPIDRLPAGEKACVRAVVGAPPQTARLRRGMELTRCIVFDESGTLLLRFFQQSYVARQLSAGQEYLFYGRVQMENGRPVMVAPVFEAPRPGREGGRVVPVYSLTAGLRQGDVQKAAAAALSALPERMEDVIPPEIRERYGLPHIRDTICAIHCPQTVQQAQAARRRAVFEELFLLSCGLSQLRQRRAGVHGLPMKDLSLRLFYRALPFELTGAQQRAIEQCCMDIAEGRPLSRLVQGDVGSGKTMVAAALGFLAARNGYQTAIMAPTELLAQQHLQTMQPLFARLGISCTLLTGSLTAKQRREALEEIENGAAHIVIGTHALISENVTFSRLGVAVVDEQHRFGVGQRAALTQKGERVHLLVMSATPIPRTLALLMYGDLDVSIIDELPPGRQKVETYAVGERMRARIIRFIDKQCGLGGQAYVVCPLVEDGDTGRMSAERCAEQLKKVLPHRNTLLVHGRMKSAEKDAVMAQFAAGKADILVSTTVIEVGVNVPNATLMVVENADCFGLSQLHQLRGRVGRGTRQSYCVFFGADKGENARKRLKTLCATNDGFAIAQADLEQRGAGDFFGTRQHGLPPLTLADPVTDVRLVEGAKRAADTLLREDPELERHPALKARVRRLFEVTGDGMFN